MKKLTLDQQRAIECVKHGHPPIIEMCFGQVSCGRCGNVIGDVLMGVFDTNDKMVIGHDCEKCRAIARKLTAEQRRLLPPKIAKAVKELRA